MSDDKRTRAFAGGRSLRVLSGIYKLANHASALNKVSFDPDELRLLFVQDWQRSSLTTAYELTEAGPLNRQTLYVEIENPMPLNWMAPRLEFTFNWATCREGFLVPRRKGYTVEEPARILIGQTPLRSKFEEVVMHECRIAYEWGLVLWVFEQLNQPAYNTTPAQVRYIWPALLPILRMANEHAMANELASPSSRAGDSARCPSWVLPYIKPTYDIIAKGVILHEVPEVEVDKTITYKLYSPTFKMDNGLSFKGYVPT
jgi:hypothetical protein